MERDETRKIHSVKSVPVLINLIIFFNSPYWDK